MTAIKTNRRNVILDIEVIIFFVTILRLSLNCVNLIKAHASLISLQNNTALIEKGNYKMKNVLIIDDNEEIS